jgi:hypothetical protein
VNGQSVPLTKTKILRSPYLHPELVQIGDDYVSEKSRSLSPANITMHKLRSFGSAKSLIAHPESDRIGAALLFTDNRANTFLRLATEVPPANIKVRLTCPLGVSMVNPRFESPTIMDIIPLWQAHWVIASNLNFGNRQTSHCRNQCIT